jgi:ribulose-phosphate 3-epimerase
MSVNPGFGGQSFIPHTVEKIRRLKALLKRTRSHAVIEVDGGIDDTTAGRVVEAGAEILVAGQAIFGSGAPEEAVSRLRAAALADARLGESC